MSSDCRDFADLLLDLAYGELDDAEASRLHDHAASCPACRAELDGILLTRKLVGELPKPETVPHLAELVLAEADRVATSYSTRPSESGAADARRLAGIASPGPSFIDRLRAAIFKPAFATALAATVVFAISFYLYRNAAPDRDEEVGAPGAPFYGPSGVMSAAAPPASPSSIVVAREDGMRAAEEAAGLGAESRSRAALGTGDGVAQAKGSLGTAGPAQVNSADELDRGAPGFGDLPAAAPAAEGAPSWSSGGSTGYSGGGKTADAASAAKAAPSDRGDADLFAEGMAAYDRGDCAAANVSLERVVDSYAAPPGLVAKALHHLARCARRSGSCGRAVVYYERLFSQHPGYEDRPEAMWEAAACHRRLGHVEQALALLRQLSELPGWEGRAEAETKSIESLAADQ
jgi:TolA-binding protein